MAVLNAWQKIDRVITGLPFGNGSDGAYSSATIPTLTKDSCSGSSSSTTLTTAGSTFANGDVLLIHQSRGTGVGQWEINKVTSGGGTTTLTLQTALQYTYTDSGASQAQAIKIPQYSSVTVQSGSWTVPTWDGNTGGIIPIACSGTFTVTGTIAANAKGYVGPPAISSANVHTSAQGEGDVGAGGNFSVAANGTGGGGSFFSNDGVPAAGGGHATVGGDGFGGSQPSIHGGVASDSADLLNMVFGGAGGDGNTRADAGTSGKGGNSGGIVLLMVSNLSVAGGITVAGENGGNDGNGTQGGGGAGSGGSILVACATATLGSGLLVGTGGTGGTGNNGSGGNGGTGRISIHHSGAVTGTSSPSFDDTTDAALIVATSGGAAFLEAFV